MSYKKLNNACLEQESQKLDLKSSVVRFLRTRCQDLRYDEAKEAQEKSEGIKLGRSIKANQIDYNMQMDIDRLCLENAMERFLDSGSAQDAFDVYFCYLEMFVGSYGESRMMIEMLSEFEMNGSSVLMKHRDHYSHSVYVFAIGLAIYEANSAYREVYQKYYGFSDEKEAAHHFLEFWGLSSLFHDIGYPFELPFEQVESYFEVRGEKRKNNPFLSYRGMEKFIRIHSETRNLLKAILETEQEFATTDELFAYEIAHKLGKVYGTTEEELRDVFNKKPRNPDYFGYYIDHAYFSSSILFQELYNVQDKESKVRLSKAGIDALTAIILHNSLYKFSVAQYKEEGNVPFEMELHPLAYMLMICDELQCWDRTSYGRNSRTELHPMNCVFSFKEQEISAVYVYDQAEKDKIDRYEDAYKKWDKTDKAAKPQLKAYANMVHDNKFLKDINRIVNTKALGLKVSVKLEAAQHRGKNVFLSDSNFIHLYNFAVALNARYSHCGHEEEVEVVEVMEKEFNELSLEYKLSNIGQAKAFAGYLNAIHCFYTDKPVDFDIVTEFTEEDMAVIGPMEHRRWLLEHKNMGWCYGEAYSSKEEREQKRIHKLMMKEEITEDGAADHYAKLPVEEQDKDTKPMNSMLKLIKQYEGLRIYRL